MNCFPRTNFLKKKPRKQIKRHLKSATEDEPSKENKAISLCLTQADKPVEAITLCALRHTAIIYRLIYGGEINLLTLAWNARTSIGMVVDILHKKKAIFSV
jgi:hypothetical protein